MHDTITVVKENYTYTVRIEEAEEGGYIATVPTLPGVITQGETMEEIKYMVNDAITCYIEALKIQGDPIPIENPALVTQVSVAVDAHPVA